MEERKLMKNDNFVAVEIEELSQQFVKTNIDQQHMDSSSTNTTPTAKFMNNMSRKGAQRIGTNESTQQLTGGVAGNENCSINGVDGIAFSTVSSPVASRRRNGVSRRPSPWLDPRRVLLIFASLSSMGTLILLFFTLYGEY